MTDERIRKLIRDFFDAIARGDLPEELVTPDMTAWTVSSGETEKAKFHGGVKLLASIFDGTLVYEIDALTAEGDRVAAEVRSHGTLNNGEPFGNDHVFLFRIRDGRIARVAEFMNQMTVNEKLMPLFQIAMAGSSDRSD